MSSETGSTTQYFRSEGVDFNATYPNEPMRLQEGLIDDLLLWCVSQKSSDISFQTDRPLYNDIAGTLRPGTKRPLDSADMAILLSRIYGADALARLASGTDLDLSYEIRPDRFKRVRFRVNITPILSRGRDAAQITMRVLPDEPPRLQDLNVEQEIIDNWAPRDGLVLVTGPTGSGKSTLLAAGNRMMIERAGGCGKMLCYESPIEFVYDTITSENSLVAQSEIPRHLKSFDAGVRNALRRKPNIILVGEARDRETISACIEAGQTGHAVYSTVHTIGVAATIRRMVATFESGERAERAYALMETVRMIITQILIPKEGGGRVGLREWLVFDDALRERMLEISPEHWPAELIRVVRAKGRSMAESARLAHSQGLINDYYYKLVARTTEEANKETAATPPAPPVSSRWMHVSVWWSCCFWCMCVCGRWF
jgi:defect-in-organelle-trafficking protein DotB